MAKDKKPSIFADRGNIGSPDELDEYGVWVKSEPQDLSQAFPEIDGISTEIPDTNELDSAIPDLEDLPDFDTLGVVSQDSDASLNIPDDDFSLPDLEPDLEIDDKTDKAPVEDNDSDVFNFGELSEPVDLDSGDLDSAKLDSVEPAPDNDEDFKEISMDEFVGAQESTDSLESEGSLELDESLEFDESLELDEPDESEDSLESFDSLESSDSLEFSDLSEPAAQIESIADTENVIAAAPVFPKEKGTQTLDLSTQLLMKIAEELSSIRNELGSLKREFSGLKTAAPQAESTDKDILGEEDDEKISLTGDEMNNILNTADFTEEAGSDAGISLSEENEDDSGELSLSTADLDVGIDLSDTGELNEILEKGVEPMTPPPAPEDTNYLTDDPLAEGDDSKDLPPDLAEAAADESIDLSEAVIDEPDLSLEIHDNPLEEPSLEDISINLDLSDLDTLNLDSPEPDSSESGSIELESPELESAENDVAAPLSEDDSQSEDELSLLPESFEIEGDDLGDISGKEETLDDMKEEIEEIQEIPEDVIEEIEDFLPEAEETIAEESAPAVPASEPVVAEAPASTAEISGIPANLKTELKTVLSYMDQLLEALPDDKIEEFAKSEYYDTYKKLFKELGLV
jgi:hypothetical protein